MFAAVLSTNPLFELPPLLRAVVDAVGREDMKLHEQLALIGRDPGFAVQILRLVNSGICGRLGRISSLRHASGIIDSQAFRRLSLTAAVYRWVREGILAELDLTRFWEDSVRRGTAAQVVAERDPDLDVDPLTAFAIGFLQDLGALVLLSGDPERCDEWSGTLDLPAEMRRRVEHDLFGTSHEQVADEISKTWGLPPILAVPMRFHHHPEQAPPEFQEVCRLGTRAELLASVLASRDRRTALDRARQVLALELGWSASDVDDTVVTVGERALDVGRAFGLGMEGQSTLDTILDPPDLEDEDCEALSAPQLRERLHEALRQRDLLGRQLVARERELERLAVTDALTGLPNHRAVFGRLSYEVSRTARTGAPVCVLLGDIDELRRVNDHFGNEIGDRVLQAVAVALAGELRQTDIVARVGGEEFAIVLPDTPAQGGRVVADKLRHRVASGPVATPDGKGWTPTVSFGLAVLEGPWRDRFDPDEVALRLYSAAEVALYESKRTGRDRVTFAQGCIAWRA